MQIDIDRADLDQLLLRGNGALLYAGAEGRIVRERGNGVIISDILEGARLCELLRRVDPPEADCFQVKSEDAVRAVSGLYGLTPANRCSQWVYAGDAPPDCAPRDIRLLQPEHAEFAAKHYHLYGDDPETVEIMRQTIAAGQLWGIFDAGRLAGFAGLHSEGSMGMLEILPDYRRRRLGFALEAYLIGWHLRQGWTPYGHVMDGNGASCCLQEMLGMRRAALPAIWIY